MNNSKVILTIAVIGAGLAMQSVAEDTGALAAVEALAAAMEAQDDAAIVGAFTEDAGYAYSVDGALRRGDSFDSWIGSDITGPDAVFVIEDAMVDGGTVDTLVLWGRGGNATTEARYIFTVVDGKIDSWRATGR